VPAAAPRSGPRRRPVAIVLFARVPRAGRVKTRLVPPLSPRAALDLHVALVHHAARVVRRAARRTGAVTVIAWSAMWEPPAKGPLAPLAAAFAGWTRRPQTGGDLGRRMRRAVRGLLRRGHAGVVVVGSDAPLVEADWMVRAVRALGAMRTRTARSGTGARVVPGDRAGSAAPVVLGPAVDGGYYLIGLASDRPDLFTGMRWGSGRVLRATRARLRRTRTPVILLPGARDIDRPADLAWLRAALADRRGRRAPAVAAFLRRLGPRQAP